MKKAELVYREILFQAVEKKNFALTQSGLSKKLSLSLSIVNSAVKKLESIGALKIQQRSFRILDIKKILYFWASLRNLEKDIIFKARIETSAREIERAMPDVIFTAYTSYKFLFKDTPADYSEVYVYADDDELNEIKKRLKAFKLSESNPNFFVLKKDNLMKLYKNVTLGGLFADLWNLKQWYAKEYLNSLEARI